MPGPRSRFAPLLLAIGASTAAGCALMPSDVFTFWPQTAETSSSTSPPKTSMFGDALQLDVIFVERSLGDPLLESGLWSQIDPSGAVAPDERAALQRLGLRVGSAGAAPCPALARMLQHSGDSFDVAEASKHMRPQVRTFSVRPSEEMPIETNSVAECTVDVPAASKTHETAFKGFKSVLRLVPTRMSDGWARLEFVPEIHYGSKQEAAEAKTPAASPAPSQNAHAPEILAAQRFSASLHVGEMIVITAEPNRPRTFGHHSFVVNDAKNGPLQRLLVIRLSKMAQDDPATAQRVPAKR